MIYGKLRKQMQNSVFRTLSLLITLASCQASAAPITFFGEDLGPIVTPVSAADIPNSLAARSAFESNLATLGIETFESIAVGTDLIGQVDSISFQGAGITGTISGQVGGAIVQPLGAFSQFPVSGTNFLRAPVTLRIDFSSPIDGFGLFVTDYGEGPFSPADNVPNLGTFHLLTERSPGQFELFDPVHTFIAPDGSVLFFGVIDEVNPFTNFILENVDSTLQLPIRDSFGYDDMLVGFVGSVPEPTTFLLFGLGLAGLVFARKDRVGGLE